MKKRIGVLLVNLGTPKSWHGKDVFYYLNEFLTDSRVIDYPWLKRQCLVRGLIVPLRYRQSSEQYRQIWTPKGSPLLVHGQELEKKLQDNLGEEFKVSLAMRYQIPSILSGLEKLKQEGLDELIILPLFPQYASATTGSIHQKVMEIVQTWTAIPKLTFISHYFDHPGLINAFCKRAESHDLKDYDHILFSFHGLPERHIRSIHQGRKCLNRSCCETMSHHNQFCYRAQCFGTAKAIVNQLNLQPVQYTICFQSRLGREPWIQPYTSEVLRDCAKKGYKKLLVFCPSFVCDCLETTYEIAHEENKNFQQMGGEYVRLVEGLNSHADWVEGLKAILFDHLSCNSNSSSNK